MGVVGSCILLSAFFGIIWYIVRKYWHIWNVHNRIPGPRAYPLVGNVLHFNIDSDDFFDQIAGTCSIFESPRMMRVWLGPMPALVIFGAEEAEKILGSMRHTNKGYIYRMLHPWLGLGLLTSPAEKWRPRRKQLTPTFHYDILKGFVDVFNQQALVLVDRLEKASLVAKAGMPIDIYQQVTLCALDIICETAMGRSINAQMNVHSEYVTAVYKINDIIYERIKSPWLWPDILFQWLGRGKEHDCCLKILHNFTQNVIDERYQQLEKQGWPTEETDDQDDQALTDGNNNFNSATADVDTKPTGRRLAFLDLLLGMVSRGELPMSDVREEVDTFMFEGHDTTATSMNWALFLMASNPQVQQKAAIEVDQLFAGRPLDDRRITYEELGKLKYLECCIKEALRLFPSVPLLTRGLKQDALIGGHRIMSGTQVILAPFMVHRDPKHWPDPEIYNPDRFLPENAAGRHPYAYVPFSAGARNCIGQRFALMEEKTVLAWVLRRFRLRVAHRRDQVRTKAELILRPCDGVHLYLEPRHAVPTPI